MPDITLEAAEAKFAELGELMTKLRAQAATTVHTVFAAQIELRPGERYAGAVLNTDGSVKHHLVLMAAKPEDDLSWQAAMDWAKSVGGELPTRQEQAILFANCKDAFEARWYWSSQTHETNASCAWYCRFSYGNQSDTLKSYEGCARAVRRA